MAAKSDAWKSPQSAATRKTEGSPLGDRLGGLRAPAGDAESSPEREGE